MPSTPPTWSTTAATCTSACVSTPAVTEHVVSTMVIAIPSCRNWVKGWHALAGRVPEPGTVDADPDPVPHPTGECRLRASRRIVRKTTRRVSRFVSQTNPKTNPTVDTTPLETVDADDRCTLRSSLCRVGARSARSRAWPGRAPSDRSVHQLNRRAGLAAAGRAPNPGGPNGATVAVAGTG